MPLCIQFTFTQAGHYCYSGAVHATPLNETWGWLCPVGHYCPRGTPSPQPCPAGTYMPLEGRFKLSTHVSYYNISLITFVLEQKFSDNDQFDVQQTCMTTVYTCNRRLHSRPGGSELKFVTL